MRQTSRKTDARLKRIVLVFEDREQWIAAAVVSGWSRPSAKAAAHWLLDPEPIANLSITSEPRSDHAAYIDGWLCVLKKDKGAIFVAAGRASQAAEYLLNL